MRIKLIIIAISTPLLSAIPVQAKAEKLMMICENPRREYLLAFNEATRSLFADKTPYRVLAVEKNSKHFLVTGLTINDGPTFRLHFRPYKKIEFFSNNQLIQTDGCRTVK